MIFWRPLVIVVVEHRQFRTISGIVHHHQTTFIPAGVQSSGDVETSMPVWWCLLAVFTDQI
jgi:hypothetical protein